MQTSASLSRLNRNFLFSLSHFSRSVKFCRTNTVVASRVEATLVDV